MSGLTDPPLSRQRIFFFTGAIAGICSATADFAYDQIAACTRGTPARPSSALIQSMIPHTIRPAIRFWGFDIARTVILPERLSAGLKGGLAGAVGGFLEMALANAHTALTSSKRLSMEVALRTTLLHSCKLFLCFGSYTYLANTYSERLPPTPFSYCLFLGGLAGAFGTFVLTPLEMLSAAKVQLSPRKVLQTAMTRAPRGAVGVGTVIAVQVTSSAWLLERY